MKRRLYRSRRDWHTRQEQSTKPHEPTRSRRNHLRVVSCFFVDHLLFFCANAVRFDLTRAMLSGLLLAALLSQAVAQETAKLYPVDESAKDASFKAFRDKLLDAAKMRDRQFILSILDPKIQVSFGGDGGVKDFQQHWKLDQPDSKLWDELITILSLGGTFSKAPPREFCAPYVYTRFPDQYDPFEYSAITGSNVVVRARPNPASAAVTSLSYDIVKLDVDPAKGEQNGTPGWIKIITPKGQRGYVSSKYIRSPVDYRACFRKVRGKWLMTFLVAGD